MGCASCGNGVKSKGCNNNGACETGGCNKLNVFDWLSDINISTKDSFNIVEVRFKNGRKDFFRNKENMFLTKGDPVVVDIPNGHDLGFISLQGELVRLQMRKKNVKEEDVRDIYRKAHHKDIEKYEHVKDKEQDTLYATRKVIDDMGLGMKLTDVEYQADQSKATFYYSAEDRVDFRELIKVLASMFKVRIEMRQISLRQEAGYIGGIGSCGRELCCSTWLTDFKSVSTGAARYQNLSLNPSKLSGQCGRLKCCLNYELDTYKEALKHIPQIKKSLKTEKGFATLQKTDIFRKILWFSYEKDNNWYPVAAKRVAEIVEMNENGKKPFSLLENEEKQLGENIRLNSDLDFLDKKYKKGKKKKKKKKSRKKRNPRITPDNQK